MPIGKANAAPPDGHIHIFGNMITGRSYQALQNAMEYERVLYVGFSNNALATLSAEHGWEIPETWDSVIIRSSQQFALEVVAPAKKGEFDYQVIILDDFDTMFEYLLGTSVEPSRNDYLHISFSLAQSVSKINALTELNGGYTIMVSQVMPMSDDDPTPRHYFSRSVVSKVFPKFARSLFTSVQGNKLCVQPKRKAASLFMNGDPVS